MASVAVGALAPCGGLLFSPATTLLSPMTSPAARAFAPLIFLLSGCSALVFQALWFRLTGYVLGSSIWSATAVLTAFMAGLALGNYLMARFGARVERPFRFYVVMELAIALTGVLSIYILPEASPYIARVLAPVAGDFAGLTALRFLVALIVLLLPATAMGATLPVLQKALHELDASFAVSVGRLYGWNTLGAVCGVLLTEFLLIEHLGLRGSGWLAAFLNITAAVIALQFVERGTGRPAQHFAAAREQLFKREMLALVVAAFVAGFTLLALEVVWFRYIVLTQVGSSLVFAVMLAIVLLGIALGGLLVERLQWSAETGALVAVGLPLLSVLAIPIGYAVFQFLVTHYPRVIFGGQYAFIAPAILLMLPASVISGMLFPLYGEYLYRMCGVNTQATGMLTLANTAGAALGSLLATVVLLPALGIEKSLLLLGLTYLLLSLLSLSTLSRDIRVRLVIPGQVLVVVGALFLYPYGSLDRSYEQVARWRYPGEKLIHHEEELNATLQYYVTEFLDKPVAHRLVTNSYSMSSTDFYSRRYMQFFAYLPASLHGNVRDVLQISYGVGNTAEAIVSLPTLEHFDVVDISGRILENSQLIHDATGIYPLKDVRTKIHVEDGRFFLQTTNRSYDLITGEPPPPKMAGIANLYTQEYFSLLKQRLKAGGLATYWLPAHNLYESDALAIISAFCQVFSDCSLWNGSALDFVLLGSRDGMRKVSPMQMSTLWQGSAAGALRQIGFELPEQIFATYLADNVTLRDLTKVTPPLSDDFPQRISPDFRGVFSYRGLYEQLLDPLRRKREFQASKFVESLFYQPTINSVSRYFDDEAALTAMRIAPLGYLGASTPGWDRLASMLANSNLQTLPLLFFGLDPLKARLVDAERIENCQHAASQVAWLLAQRKWADIVELRPSCPELMADELTAQAYFFAAARVATRVDPALLADMQKSGIKRGFSSWLSDYFN